MKFDKVSPLKKEDKEKDDKSQNTLSVLSERRFSEVSSLASLQSGICRSLQFLIFFQFSKQTKISSIQD